MPETITPTRSNPLRPPRRVLIMGSQTRAMANFWPPLIKGMVGRGHEVFCLNPDSSDPADHEAARFLQDLGASARFFPMQRKGTNPLADLAAMAGLYRLCREIRPDVFFGYAIKPVIYGTLAAALARVPERFAMITGLGYAFEADTPRKQLLNKVAVGLYRLALGRSHGVFFQNRDDLKVFRNADILDPGAPVHMTRGTGVDVESFSFCEPPATPPVFLLVGRLLEAKGLREYAAAARLLKARHPEARFQILGPPDSSPAGIPLDEVHSWEMDGYIEYLGATTDVRPFVRDASVMVLPSWREGAPCSILEGLAMGRPAVVTDVPGCREVVVNGENGWMTPLRDVDALAAAMEKFILDPGLIARQGQTGRAFVEDKFDARKVSLGLMAVMGL